MKMNFFLFFLFLPALFCFPSFAQRDKEVKIISKSNLTTSCVEKSENPTLKLNLSTIFSSISSPESIAQYAGATKQIIIIKYKNKTAKAEINANISGLTNIDEILKHLLGDKFVDNKKGIEYIYTPVVFDENSQQYPTEFLRIKAPIVPSDLQKDSLGFTDTHYSINLALPEIRIQNSDKSFTAYGYLHYSVLNHHENFFDNLIIGLVELKCTIKNQVF